MTVINTHEESAPFLEETDEFYIDESLLKGDVDTATIWKSESWLLCRYSAPLIATYLLEYSFTVITTIVAGHLGAEELAAASLGGATRNIIGYAFVEGMATALDTLCSQAYGSGRPTGVGLHVQRMTLFMALAMIPIAAFWYFSPWILPLLIPQHELGVKAGVFMQVSILGLPGYAFFEVGKRFLQAQGDFKIGLVVLIVCTPVNAFMSWFLAIKMGMGLNGAALGQAIASDLTPILLLLYVVYYAKWSHKCWGGWSWDAIREWGPMLSLSASGTVVNLAEWIALEILSVSASYIGTDHLAAQTILMTVSLVAWHIPFSISVAATTRLGVLVGAGLTRTAQRVVVLYGAIFLSIGTFDAFVMFTLRNQLSRMFTGDSTVVAIAIDAMTFSALFHIIDSMNCAFNGILRGLARQSVAAWVSFSVSYLVSVPLALWLALGSPDMKLNGQWIGLGAGMLVGCAIEFYYLRRLNWQNCIDDAREREKGDL